MNHSQRRDLGGCALALELSNKVVLFFDEAIYHTVSLPHLSQSAFEACQLSRTRLICFGVEPAPRSGAAFHHLLKKGNMESKRILELALETLEKQRAEVDAAIAEISELKGRIRRGIVKKPGAPTLVMAKRRSRTAAERKAQSLRMKRIWAEKIAAKAAKDKEKTPERKLRTVAQKRALSLKMKEAWAKKKAEAAKNEPNAKTLSKNAAK